MCEECAWERTLTMVSETREKIKNLPEKAANFGASIDKKIASMGEWIKTEEHVTVKMKRTIMNMSNGVNKWFH